MNPLFSFEVLGLEIVDTVVVSFVLTVGLGLALGLTVPRLQTAGVSTWQTILESFVGWIDDTVRDIIDDDPRPYVPLIGTLIVFIATANLVSVIPGLRAPTADLATPVALATIVFFAIPAFGIRRHGVVGYLRTYVRPHPLLLPLNLVGELTRTIALAIRLFGNMMSGQMIVAILVVVAGILFPVPLMALGIITALVQAYIFGVLVAVYIGAAVRVECRAEPGEQTT